MHRGPFSDVGGWSHGGAMVKYDNHLPPRRWPQPVMMVSLSQPCSSTFSNSSCVSSSTNDVLRKTKSGAISSHKQPHQVQRRNERERKRVQQVNMGFITLRDRVPKLGQNKKLSKVETLREAAKYIRHLQTVLAGGDASGYFAFKEEEELDYSTTGQIEAVPAAYTHNGYPSIDNFHHSIGYRPPSFGHGFPSSGYVTRYPVTNKASSSPSSSNSYASDVSFEDCKYNFQRQSSH